MDITKQSLQYMVDHVFLPPKLPGSADSRPFATTDQVLLKCLSKALQDMASVESSAAGQHVGLHGTLQSMIEKILGVTDGERHIRQNALLESLAELPTKGGVIPVYVHAQNSGMVIRKQSDSIIFEAFELAPSNQAVMSTKGRLARFFPGPAIAVPVGVFDNVGFLSTMAETLAKMSFQDSQQMSLTAQMAGQLPTQSRDSADPHCVTEFLMSYLEAVGRPVSVSRLWKRTRDEVLGSDGFPPWRRSPIWLLARVALQTASVRLTGSGIHYKEFMIFFMAELTARALQLDLPCDIVHCMVAKISRRLSKLGHGNSSRWFQHIDNILRSATDKLQTVWDAVATSDLDLPTQNLTTLHFHRDCDMQLDELKDYIAFIRQPVAGEQLPLTFTPPELQTNFPNDTFPNLSGLAGADTVYVLAAFEEWISSNLPGWLATHVTRTSTCGRLCKALEKYHRTASLWYKGNPESISSMILTCLDLWVACDKSATLHHPLLLGYRTEIPSELLQSLLLPLKADLERLGRVEDHLKDREMRADGDYPSLFSMFGLKDSFAVRSYGASTDHINLRAKIQAWALQERELKKNELAKGKDEFARLMKLYESLKCDFMTISNPADHDRRQNVHSPSCRRCAYRNQATSMTIDVHEWPLPENELSSQATVFELKLPGPFSNWRAATLLLKMEVLKSQYDSRKCTQKLYDPSFFLLGFMETSPQRLCLKSKQRPISVTRKRSLLVSEATEAAVCVNNGLVYQYFDDRSDCFTTSTSKTDQVPGMCTYQLQHFKMLQDFIYRPYDRPCGPRPNLVISRQHSCPADMSLEEFRSLATLPLGTRLQWRNILLQLSVPTIDFAKTDTSLVVLQVIHQVGPRGDQGPLRDGHSDLRDEGFGRRLVQALRAGLERIKENWESRHALETFIAVSARVLSLTDSEEIVESCRAYLRLCRQVALDWASKLRIMAQDSTTQRHRDQLLRRAFEAALVCTTTFDVDARYLVDELHQPSEIAAFIECSVVIHDTTHAALDTDDVVQHISIQRWRRLSSRALRCLQRETYQDNNPGINIAIGKCWSGFRPGTGWQPHSDKTEHWVTTTTGPTEHTTSQVVLYNILSGELRVGGLPVSRLPPAYEGHPMYKVLFDRSTIEVMRTYTAGRDFSATRPFRGYELFFALRQFVGGADPTLADQDLMLTCVKDDQRYHLLPPRVFKTKLPDHFVDDYVHWYNSDKATVEFRPISDPWNPSESNWALSQTQHRWTLAKDGALMVNTTSHTGMEISRLLEPIESARYIHLIFHRSQGQLDIALPRLNLDFYLAHGTSRVASRQFKSMYLDANQRIGTLVGLKSKIVMRDDKNDRLVLIPDGKVSWASTEHHIEVQVRQGSSTKVYPFGLDMLLRRVTDNGTLESKLALCYLHALTSFCLPDELTGRTGTEQALEMLNSASVRSFGEFSDQNVEVLHDIANLTPRRAYYPKGQSVMQSVQWVQGLNPLLQHGQIFTDVARLLAEAASLHFFHPRDAGEKKDLEERDLFLVERDLIRSSVFRCSGFGAQLHTAKHDNIYDSISQRFFIDNTGDLGTLPDELQQPVAAIWEGRRLSRTTGKGVDESRYDAVLRTASRVYQGLQSRQSEAPTALADHLYGLLKLPDAMYDASQRMECRPLALPDNLLAYDAARFFDWKKFLGSRWCQIHHALAKGGHDKFRVMMFLASLAYGEDADAEVIEILVALFSVPAIREVQVPQTDKFNLAAGHKLIEAELLTILQAYAKRFEECPEYMSPSRPSESYDETVARRRRDYDSKNGQIMTGLIADFLRQWPCDAFQIPTMSDMNIYVNFEPAIKKLRTFWRAKWDCHRFYAYLCRIEAAIQQQPVHPLSNSMLSVALTLPEPAGRQAWLSEDDLFSLHAPLAVEDVPKFPEDLTWSVDANAAVAQHLKEMIMRLKNWACLRHEKEYVEELEESSEGLKDRSPTSSLKVRDDYILHLLTENIKCCKGYVDRVYSSLVDGLNYTTHLPLGGIGAKYNSPRVCPSFFLKQLARDRWGALPPSWKDAVVAYGLAMTMLQRALRLFELRDKESDLIKELLNPGHENWSARSEPEYLLIEVESGILIRKVQAEIAEQMKHPAGNENSVMQLNMGEGKSSVIVPIVAAALADGSRLVRVVVAKPQSKQMFQMLVSKLGGLCNRQIHLMPFSRSLTLGLTEVEAIHAIYHKCMETGGILLVQPEHILSFRLAGIETNLSGEHHDQRITESLLRTQDFFNKHSRDIVDESDENFSVKFELVYTMGTQRPIDFSPDRWCLIQSVLRIIRKIIPTIQQELPSYVELEQGPEGSFSRLRLLRRDAEDLFCRRVAEEICTSGLPGFAITRQPENLRSAVFRYITEPDLTPEDASAVEGHSTFCTDAIKQPLLLLRGLLAAGVLAFAFGQKRWRVNYGLTPTRRPKTRLAVPYRAKDSPAPRSEFSHPDVVIVLTCLCYYYGGLDDEELFEAFETLIKSDQAATEYQEWLRDAPSLPLSFRNLSGINLKDRYQCLSEIFPHLRQSQAVLDFFLARCVFPRHMKEFPHKLSASGWDIGEIKPNPTTGFSGTNDSKHLLPLTMRHLDLGEHRHTNALVLLHLLQPKNEVKIMPPPSPSEKSDAARLLQLVVGLEEPVQVILDVGAQVIELSNFEVAAEWLKMTASSSDKRAVVFFDEFDNMMVRDRTGHVEAFQSSPYARQLDLCYVFLDEAHTRGIDLKLPQNYRAMVTLGAGLTKDRLVQACMRMRKLGQGQSVVFCIPEEIRMKILAVTEKAETAEMDIADVLIWSISETCSDLRKSMPLWAAQGMRHERQSVIWARSTNVAGITMSRENAEKFLEKESLGLDERYAPRDDAAAAAELFVDSDQYPRAAEIRTRCEGFESIKFTAATLQEEQERELCPEVEAERQVERPRPVRADQHCVHPDVQTFIRTGKIKAVEPAFCPAFNALSTVSAAGQYDISQFPTDLLVTSDFARTVELVGKLPQSDAFQRPVQWVVTTRVTTKAKFRMVIISPYEAQELMPDVKASSAVFMHLYAPRSNLAFQPLDDLKLYTVPELPDDWHIPAQLVFQLNLFSGQLYFQSYDEYKSACEFLGLAWQATNGNMVIEPDGFIVTDSSANTGCRFKKSPTKFLQALLATIRRDGRDIGKTHWGRVLVGEVLNPDEFEDVMDESE